jgi:hypothetical protein
MNDAVAGINNRKEVESPFVEAGNEVDAALKQMHS